MNPNATPREVKHKIQQGEGLHLFCICTPAHKKETSDAANAREDRDLHPRITNRGSSSSSFLHSRGKRRDANAEPDRNALPKTSSRPLEMIDYDPACPVPRRAGSPSSKSLPHHSPPGRISPHSPPKGGIISCSMHTYIHHTSHRGQEQDHPGIPSPLSCSIETHERMHARISTGTSTTKEEAREGKKPYIFVHMYVHACEVGVRPAQRKRRNMKASR